MTPASMTRTATEKPAPHFPVPTLSQIRDLLVVERERLLLAAADLRGVSDSVGHASSDPHAGREREQAEHLLNQTLEALHELDEALTRVDVGSYGRCESCRGPISAERLEAIPQARCCVSCQGRTTRR